MEHLPQHISGHLQRCASVGTDDTDDDEEYDDSDDTDDDIEATSQHFWSWFCSDCWLLSLN